MGSHDIGSGLRKAGVRGAVRHLFLCLGPECCPMREGERVWDYLKKRCKDLSVPVMRTKAGCFRVCEDGPLLLIYPEGTWYSRVNIPRLERILQQHVEGGRPIAEWAVASNSLGRQCTAAMMPSPPAAEPAAHADGVSHAVPTPAHAESSQKHAEENTETGTVEAAASAPSPIASGQTSSFID